LGLSANAEAGEDLGLVGGDVELIDADTWGTSDIDELRLVGLLPPILEDAAVKALLEAAKEELPNSIDNAVLGRAGENAVRSQLAAEGWQLMGEQVRVLVKGEDNNWTLRIYDFVARSPTGQVQFLEAKTNGAIRNTRQTNAYVNMELTGGIIVGHGATLGGLPFGTVVGPSAVAVVNVIVTRSY
jgi:hypothetical protein